MNDDKSQLQQRWHQRARHALSYSLKLRLVLMFLLLAAAVTLTFTGGAQKAFSDGWRDAARPILSDYIDRLSQEVGNPPSIERARALTERLPITLRISGPQINWQSHPEQTHPEWMQHRANKTHGGKHGHENWQELLSRRSADGHTLEVGIDEQVLNNSPLALGFTLATLLLTLLAYLYVRRLLRPLDDIRNGAQRFGEGQFSQSIPVKHAHRPDELGHLAATINTMGQDIKRMLDAKRALLLAISHELRSPLTRARLNTELLPETTELRPQRDALLRDLQEMARLISDLLESERLASPHAALQREPIDLSSLAREVIDELSNQHPKAARINVQVADNLPQLALDPSRIRLLLRNLLDNALRHSSEAEEPVEIHLKHATEAGQQLQIEIRDYGPGVPAEQLIHLSEAFYRPDKDRGRSTGGVGLGLYLCRLVVEAHGGHFSLSNASPGLRARIQLPDS